MGDDRLRIDWLPAERIGPGGRLGLTILPGKRGASTRYPGRIYDRDLDADLAALRAAGVVRLVLLVDDGELARFGTPGRPPETWRPPVIRFPMPDGTAPPDVTTMDRILAEIEGAREAGNVAVACMGGVGRTGTVTACALVARGVSPPDAIAEVRRVRHPEAVETAEQEAFVRAYARHRSGG
ncbi:MAG TPA: protein-tyrosine phosphatase family protein [Candidatus Limnocylindria bacterium]|nr:protein-tyrosine phosphatase family protein [Candidatus Limnocylindria bacterium]